MCAASWQGPAMAAIMRLERYSSPRRAAESKSTTPRCHGPPIETRLSPEQISFSLRRYVYEVAHHVYRVQGRRAHRPRAYWTRHLLENREDDLLPGPDVSEPEGRWVQVELL